jgi:hypothetical protein
MPQSSSHFSSNPSLNIAPMQVASPLPTFSNRATDPTQPSTNGLRQLVGLVDSTLRLPDSPRAFAVYLLGLCIVFIGAFLHVLVAAQIMQAEFRLNQLREEYRIIEQQNGDIIFQIARDTNMQRLHERVLARGYVPVQEREYLFPSSTALAKLKSPIAPATEAVAQGTISAETEPVQAVAPQAAVQASLTENLGGQFARWEEFWYSTWRAATGRPPITPSTVTTGLSADISADISADLSAGSAQISKSNTNFWAVWWEQASEQGSKFLERFSSQ